MHIAGNSAVFCASVITALGWLYAALASFWPILFHREAVKHAAREQDGYSGYRMGWIIYWRLPARIAIPITLVSPAPLLAVALLDPGIVTWLLVLSLGVILFLWIFVPPGMALAYVEASHPGERHAFELKSSHRPLRAVVILAIFGVAPALLIGAVLIEILERLG